MRSKTLATILFIYSLIVSSFITISGFLSAPSMNEVLTQAFFLPITGFFVVSAIKLARKDEDVLPNLDPVKKKGQLVAGAGIFLVLLVVGVIKILIK